MTTTGVSAAIPVLLAIVEAIAGRARAAELAQELGVADWSARHDSDEFHLSAGLIWTGLGNAAAFWRHADVGIPVADGVDELALALLANAWSVTFESQAVTFATTGGGAVTTRRGLTLIPDRTDSAALQLELPDPPQVDPARALDRALEGIRHRYGADTANLVAHQLEIPRAGA